MSSSWVRTGGEAPATSIQWRPAGGKTPLPEAPDLGQRQAEPARSLEARIDSAREQGRAEGEAAALQQGNVRLNAALQQLGALNSDLASQGPRIRAECEEDAVNLAIVIARRVLHRELATDPDAILGLVKAAFAKLNARDVPRLRLSPADALIVEENRPRLAFPPGLDVIADGSLLPGSAVFETSRGELDAGIDTQLAEIERGLADVMRRKA